MGNNIEIFKSEKFGEIRTVINECGDPLFCLADVCKALGLTNPTMVKQTLWEDGLSSAEVIDSMNRVQSATFITEANIYKCIFQSKKEEAQLFQRWICTEIIPSIRKHGGYLTPAKVEEALLNPDVLIQLATTLKDERQKRIEAEKQLEAKTEALDESKNWYTIKRRALILGVNWKLYNWRDLKRLSVLADKPIKKVFDANYGEVNLYHLSIFETYEKTLKR